MGKYMILYRSTMSPEEQMAAPGAAEAGMQEWMSWAGRAGSALVDMGSPVGPVATEGAAGDTGVAVCGFSILEADSPDAVKGLLEGHPHLSAPGGSFIEVLEYLPIPGM
jgi:hypothetical protein